MPAAEMQRFLFALSCQINAEAQKSSQVMHTEIQRNAFRMILGSLFATPEPAPRLPLEAWSRVKLPIAATPVI